MAKNITIVAGMSLTEKIRRASQHSKIFRYKTYKRIGWVGNRKQIDRLIMGSLIILLIVGAYFLLQRDTSPVDTLNCAPNCPVEPVINDESQEIVHSDFGDEPVIEEESPEVALNALEERVKNNTAKVKTLSLNKNESLAALFARANLAKQNQAGVIDTLSAMINIKTIRAGTTIIFFFDTKTDSFLGMSMPIDNQDFVAVVKNEDGDFSAVIQEGVPETLNKRVKGKIERTFSGSAQKYGAPKQVVTQILNALGNEINLRNGVRPGDKFDIIYTQKVTPGGLEIDTDRQVLYVGLKLGKNEYYRYLYTDKSGTPAFYNPLGQRGQRALEKRPVKGIPRLSSPYGWRMHPVLMYRIFHSGADLACPRGTPVYAGGDGTIIHIGRKGAYGKYIRIRHAGGYETAYGHLNGYKSGLKQGSRVKQGDIIGYVGATGRVTGPHLHYEVWKNGKTTNPFNNNVISGKQLTGFELEQFQSFAESINPDFQKHLYGKFPPIPPIKPAKNG